MVYQKTFVKEIETNVRKRPSNPQVKILNPLEKTIFVNSISLNFDPYFARRGKIVVEVGDDVVLPVAEVGAYRQSKTFQIPLENQEFYQQKSIKVWAWNPDSEENIFVVVKAKISESPVSLNSADESLSPEELNRQVSDNFVDNQVQVQLDKLDELIEEVQNKEFTANFDTAPITTKLTEVKTAVGLLPQNHTDIINKLTDTITAINNGAFSPTEIITALNSLISEVANLETDSLGIQNAITSIDETLAKDDITDNDTDRFTTLRGFLVELLNGFDVPEIDTALTNLVLYQNAQDRHPETKAKIQVVIANLNQIKNTNTVGVVSELVAVRQSVNDENTNLGNKLDGVKSSVDGISVASETIPKAIEDINLEISNGAEGDYLEALNLIKTALIGLRDDFDLDELNSVIQTLNTNLGEIRNNSDALGLLLDSLKISLEIAARNPSLIPSQVNFLFPKRVYRNETVTQFINTKGNRNLIVLLGASTIGSPDNLNHVDNPADVPINYNGFVTGGSQDAITRTKETRFDFKYPQFEDRLFDLHPEADISIDIASGSCRIYYPAGKNRGGHYITYGWVRRASYVRTFDVYESDSENFANETQLKDGVGIAELSAIVGTKRYLRIVETMVITISNHTTSSNQTNVGQGSSSTTTCASSSVGNHTPVSTTFDDAMDDAIVGGTAAISFEVKDGNNDWFETIPSSEVGAITEGQKTVFEVGEAVSGHVLPSTQTHFRAKLTVTGGGIETSASLVRVA